MDTEQRRLHRRLYMLTYWATHPEAKKANAKRYREKHREQLLVQEAEHRRKHPTKNSEYYWEHREQLLAKKRVYRELHTEKGRAYSAQYRLTHPEQIKEYVRTHKEIGQTHVVRRRTRLRQLATTLTVGQWRTILSAYGYCCAYCGVKSKRLSQDHVIPLVKGGGHTPDNIVPACIPCNSAKGARAPTKVPAKRLMV